MRHLPKKIGISCVALIVFCGAIELAARLWLGAEWTPGRIERMVWPDAGAREPYRGWALRSDLHAEIVGKHAPYVIDLDENGYRQNVIASEVSADALRVLVIGDSVSFGWGVAEDERFSSLLRERLAAELEHDVVVWNLAIPGYSIDQSLWTYERDGAPLAADVVVLCTVANDIAAAGTRQFNGKGKPALELDPDTGWHRIEAPSELVVFKPLQLHLRLSRHSAAVTLLRRLIEHQDVALRIPKRMPWNAAGARQIDAIARKLAGQYLDEEAPIHEALRRLARAVERDGATLVVLACPFGHDPHLVDPRVTSPPGGRKESIFSAIVREACAALGIVSLSVDVAFGQAVQKGAMINVGDGHPNALGHDLMASELLSVIVTVVR